MTPASCAELTLEASRLSTQVEQNDGYVTGRLDGEVDAPSFIPNIVGQQLLRQLTNARDVLAGAVIVDDPEVAVIGRRVTLLDPDGSRSAYTLSIPGHGDPRNGRVSVDSPVGAALLGRRRNDTVVIQAPTGSWTASIAEIE